MNGYSFEIFNVIKNDIELYDLRWKYNTLSELTKTSDYFDGFHFRITRELKNDLGGNYIL